MTRLHIVPITQREAFAYVERHHRHHRPPRGSIIQVAVADEDGEVHGVAIVGHRQLCQPRFQAGFERPFGA